MPLEIHPVTEDDFPDLIRIQVSAFSNGIASLLAPHPATKEYIDKQIEKHIKCQRKESDCHFLKVIDTDLGGKMIAAAKWRINEKERTEEEIQIQLPQAGEDEKGNEGAKDFMDYLSTSRKKYMGTKPFYFLHMLVTDPTHHRRGAGGMLVRWGTERADKAQLPAYLEASQEGRPLYARLGFKPIHEQTFDLTKYGGQGMDKNTVMIRDPAQ